MALTKEAILTADDLPREEVDAPEWGGTVLVSAITGTARDAFEGAVQAAPDTNSNIRALLCVRAIVDENGKRVFTDAEAGALGAKNAATLDRVFVVASRLSGMSKDDIEVLEKNLPTGQSEGSPSD